MSFWDRHVDDAAGEAFDKIARVMGLPYPGGPEIERLALGGNDHAIDFPVARLDKPYEFSFSGLKSAVINYLHNQQQAGREVNRSDVAASFQRAVVDALVKEAVHAMQHTGYNKIVLAGGVSANKTCKTHWQRLWRRLVPSWCIRRRFCVPIML